MKLSILNCIMTLFLCVNSFALDHEMNVTDMQAYFHKAVVSATMPVSQQDIDTYANSFAEALASDDLSFATGFLKIVLTNENLLLHEKTMEIGKNLCYGYLENNIVKEITDTEFHYRWSGVFQCTLTLAEKMQDDRSVGGLFTKMLKEYDSNPIHNSVERYIAVLSNQEDEFGSVLAQTLRNQVGTQYKHLAHQEVILNQLNDAVQKILYSIRMKIRETRRRETRIRK